MTGRFIPRQLSKRLKSRIPYMPPYEDKDVSEAASPRHRGRFYWAFEGNGTV